MKEITITTNKMASAVAPGWHIWGWEVPVYLFLGGLTAGIMVVAAAMILKRRGDDFLVSTNKIILWAPLLISLGMGALFLDLTHKLYVWRFYTAFRVTSVMSWGSWILLVVYPVTILMILGTLRRGYLETYTWLEDRFSSYTTLWSWFERAILFAEKKLLLWARIALPVGIGLGVYTGILLSSVGGARPVWNSAILGPLFLVSGLSTGVALILLFAKDKEHHYLGRVDMIFIVTELFVLALFFIGLMTGPAAGKEAARLFFGGSLITPVFWIMVVFFGLLLPLFLEFLESRGRDIPRWLAPVLVLGGGLILRFVLVQACCLLRELSIESLLY